MSNMNGFRISLWAAKQHLCEGPKWKRCCATKGGLERVPIFSMLQLLHSFYSTCVLLIVNLTYWIILNRIESKLSPCSLYIYLLPLQIFLLRISISSFLVPSLVATRRFPLLSIQILGFLWLPRGDRSPVGVYGKLSCSHSEQRRQTRQTVAFFQQRAVRHCASIAVQVAEKETGGLADLLSVSGIFGCQAVLEFFRYEAFFIYIVHLLCFWQSREGQKVGTCAVE